jgi:hypothetical protein
MLTSKLFLDIITKQSKARTKDTKLRITKAHFVRLMPLM